MHTECHAHNTMCTSCKWRKEDCRSASVIDVVAASTKCSASTCLALWLLSLFDVCRHSACSTPWAATQVTCGKPLCMSSDISLQPPFASYRAWTSCNLWELSVSDVLRMRALQPGMLDDIAEHFLQTASRVLRSMDATRL